MHDQDVPRANSSSKFYATTETRKTSFYELQRAKQAYALEKKREIREKPFTKFIIPFIKLIPEYGNQFSILLVMNNVANLACKSCTECTYEEANWNLMLSQRSAFAFSSTLELLNILKSTYSIKTSKIPRKAFQVCLDILNTLKNTFFNVLFINKMILTIQYLLHKAITEDSSDCISTLTYLTAVFLPAFVLGGLATSEPLIERMAKEKPSWAFNLLFMFVKNFVKHTSNLYSICNTTNSLLAVSVNDLSKLDLRPYFIGGSMLGGLIGGLVPTYEYYKVKEDDQKYIKTNWWIRSIMEDVITLYPSAALGYFVWDLFCKFLNEENYPETITYLVILSLLIPVNIGVAWYAEGRATAEEQKPLLDEVEKGVTQPNTVLN